MRHWLARIGIALAVFLVLLVAYGTLVEPRLVLDEERAQVSIPGLPEDLAGTRVAVLADFQIGAWFDNDGMARRAVGAAVEAEPDVVLLAGDFVYSEDPGVEQQLDQVMHVLEPLLHSDVPAYAVLGNHDYSADMAEELTRTLEGAGIPVLENEAVPLEGDAAGLHVVGIGPLRPGLADVSEALADVPDDAPRVVLMHNPAVFPDLPAGSAPLTLAGHTHCGQIAIPGLPRWSYLELTEPEEVVADGWAPAGYGAEGNRMFVTCGIGFSLIPVRINAAPQVAVFDLQPAG